MTTKTLPRQIIEKLKDLSPFAQKVYRACASIPKGQTRTYGQLAKMIGQPKAARAVGSALAKNPFVPIVPCHRVVPSAGGLGLYSGVGGAATKRKLLLKEGARIK